MTIEQTYRLIIIIAFIGAFQSTVENIIIAIKYPSFNKFPLKNTSYIANYEKWRAFAFDYPGNWVLLIIRLILAGVILFMGVFNLLNPIVLLLFVIVDMLGFPRWSFLSISDIPLQRVLIIATSIHLFFNDNQISILGLFFIYINLCLAYFAAGWHKIKSPAWRNGAAISKFCFSYVNIKNQDFLNRNKRYWKYIGFGVILFEVGFFLSICGNELLHTFLLCGFIFHAFLTIRCGINFFFWTFIAAYPAVIYVNGWLF